MYMTMVLVLGKMLRGYFAGSALKIMFDDLPNVDRILQVSKLGFINKMKTIEVMSSPVYEYTIYNWLVYSCIEKDMIVYSNFNQYPSIRLFFLFKS